MSNDEHSSNNESNQTHHGKKVIIHAYPKTVYLWPTMVIGILFWLTNVINNNFSFFNTKTLADLNSLFVSLWLIVIFFNLIVISFDFSAGRTVTILTTFLSISLLYILLRDYFKVQLVNILPSMEKFLVNSGLTITPVFYLYFSLILLFIYAILFIESKIVYWEFEPNRITYHKGLFNDEESFPAQQSRVITETTDIFERLLFKAGTIFVIVGDNKVHKLENVFKAASKDKEITKLLSYMEVKGEE